MKLLKATLAVTIATSTFATVKFPITTHAETVQKGNTTTLYKNHEITVRKADVSVDCICKTPVVTLPKVVEKGYVQNTNGIPLNVRAKASTKSEIIGKIKPGATVYLTKKYSTKKNIEWYEVVHNNQVGFVASQYVGFKKGQTLAPTIVKNGMVNSVTLNVRAKPSDTSRIVGKLKPGTVVTFNEQYTTSSKDQWLKIKYKKGTAYVSKQYIDFLIPAP